MALMRHGFGYMVEEMGLFQVLSLPRRLITREAPETKTVGERIRLVLEELGPAFIKLGQLLSTRSDLFPDSVIRELVKLQDQVPPFPAHEARRIVEAELNRPIGDVFSSFDDEPVAAASIGQVHLAKLHGGEAVAIKVQRPGIHPVIERDLEIVKGLTAIAERRWAWVAEYQIPQMIAEFSKSMKAELDYNHEGRNTEKIARQFLHVQGIHIPRIYWQHTSSRVLTMEYVQGVKLSRHEDIAAQGHDLKALAERFVHAMLHQMFIEGLFHADPHPGNLLVLDDGRLAFLDFGMVGRLNGDMKDYLSDLIISLMRQRTSGIIRAIAGLGVVPDRTDMTQLKRDLDRLRAQYYDIPFTDISLGQSLHDLFAVAQRHRITLPPDLIMLAKALITMEGVVEELDPTLSILDMAEPFGRKLLLEKYSPRRVRKKLLGGASDFLQALTDLPKQANQLARILSSGKVRVEVELPELDHALHKLDQISNRLSFSIVLLAFSIIMVGLIVGSSLTRKPTLLWDVPAIEIGFVVAAFMFLWLLYGIFKSGRF
ncbi:ABC1 kinase family protein [Paenibacillus apiarius]|uniref:AarF/ABC1/UbiB kinase family protein n=1 Tax=Paenibacillus apiarius TaxID=46240 RepID=A0ABT4DWJ2_9BACL|nr:AarF/ABC1/UbiB kinase family protein [Paenibacillus apiarius]MCY9515733.1 AarF/ABC1/UbiB kinase family protein [Paenibacillus apiarius]MCY9520453.1 AarF/ABC1/UbiB kinase family protein [Paenibacillus apiarius]MCY9550586.1 AarF/ABC1/UbiB kinase family protein [Paenibacillus apiarius]MCY9559107.1 AarF/ABC1/UbiB kinase family protein [Paenibacillus apiarius]MCY9683098.1 AarF/ABC1/UbiB kinase family protein [Paenibacillus apiarius]